MRYGIRVVPVFVVLAGLPLLLSAQAAQNKPDTDVERMNVKIENSGRVDAVQDAHDPTANVKAKKKLTEQEMMEAWKKASTPGEMHKKLNDMVGTFDASVRMWMDPTKPPEDSTAVSVNKWVLGDRFVESKYEGTMMGEPFNGLGYTGYDNVQKKYVGSWMDSTTTGIMTSTCTLAADGKSMTCKASFWDAMSGKPASMEMKTTWTDHDHHAMEMWGAGPDGKKHKMMEITYTRKS